MPPRTPDQRQPRRRGIPLTIACLILLQVGIPAVQLLRPGPRRFGWQMYARWPDWPTVEVHGGGTVARLFLPGELPYLRTDVRLPAGFGRQVCAKVPAADSVVVRPAGGTTRCRR